MPPSRRALLTTAVGAGALGVVGLTAAGCGKRTDVSSRARAQGLDVERLAHGFASLATRAAPGVFNLGVMTLDNSAVWYADANRRFPIQGLAAAPIAAAALAEVDAGRLKLNDTVHVRAMDLSPPPSRINEAFPNGGAALDLPAADLIALAVQEGDGTAADAVMAHVGGPGAITAWLAGHNIDDMRLDRYQREMQTDMFGMESFRPAWKDAAAWNDARASLPTALREEARARFLADPRDSASAQAALNFLNQLSEGALLSTASTRLLLSLMSRTSTPAALGAGLPMGTALAQVGGSSPTDLGSTPATNDMGLVTLPDGRRFAIIAQLAGSTGTAVQRNELIAHGARLAISALR